MTLPAAIDVLRLAAVRTDNIDVKEAVLIAEKCIREVYGARVEEVNIFDTEEVYENCTVQILSNSVTGNVSVGWWKND